MRAQDSSLSPSALQPMPSSIRKNLTGQRFGRLVVEAYAYRTAQYQYFWLCRCDCGNMHTVRSTCLTRGDTQSCGCWQAESRSKRNRLDLTGHSFGRLLVLSMTWTKARGRAYCQCACGQEITIQASNLLNGHTRSCGCLKMENPVIRKDLTGMRFGRLVVQTMEWQDSRGWATCLCDCGTVHRVSSLALQGAHPTKSCGCLLHHEFLPETINHPRYRTSAEKQAVLRFHERARRARKLGAPYDFTEEDILFMLDYWHGRCAICGCAADFWHWIAFDHWIPLRASTTPGTIPGNILPMCHAKTGAGTFPGPRACNNSKGAKDPVTWLTQRLGARKAAAKLRDIAAYFAATRLRDCHADA